MPRDPYAWRASAACLGHDDPDLWTGTGVPGKVPVEALRVCVACPVRTQCLDMALEQTDDHGVWGGTTEGARRRVRYGGLSRAEAMARGDRQAQLRTDQERIEDEEPWLLGGVA